MNCDTGEPLHVDGSQGEGGGQVVRSSLALALITGRPVVIDRIRAGRDKPGLGRQHLAAVRAAAEVGGGRGGDCELIGAEIGSRTLDFRPGPVRSGVYRFCVGTAGSATLVCQTVLPALLLADGPSTVTLEGGTHNAWAPPFDFLARTFLPLVARMGPRVTARLHTAGFYPAGGGCFTVDIEPSPRLAGFDLLERGPIRSRAVRAVVANLPRHIPEREVDTAIRKLQWPRTCGHVEEVGGPGPGNVVLIEIESECITEVVTAFGRQGLRAEQVARGAAREAQDYLDADVPVGSHLADQWLLPLGISAWQTVPGGQRGGSFRTTALTLHSITHIEILRLFLGIEIQIEASADGKTCRVVVAPGAVDKPRN